MKTGRVRKNAEGAPKPPKKETTAPPTEVSRATSRAVVSATPQSAVSRPAKPANTKIVFGSLLGIFGCFALVMILFTIFGGGKADEWVPATQARGEWTATVKIWGPQASREERWETDCRSDPQATVQPTTCILKDTERYDDQVVDDYEEFAYTIYYEETYQQVYEARGTEFAVTQLGTDDWWEQDLHYVLQEELDSGSCEYSSYTTWVDDPDDSTQEIEVYLSECEVWDHVTVYERVYEQGNWCGCDVITEIEVGQETQQGTGTSIRWPNPAVPAEGRTERAFHGTVTFQGDDYQYTTTTDDLATYQDYVTSRYYIGINDGKPIRVSKEPK